MTELTDYARSKIEEVFHAMDRYEAGDRVFWRGVAGQDWIEVDDTWDWLALHVEYKIEKAKLRVWINRYPEGGYGDVHWTKEAAEHNRMCCRAWADKYWGDKLPVTIELREV